MNKKIIYSIKTTVWTG